MPYNFEIERINSEIKRRNAKKVLIQLPEGLKQYAKELMDQINSNCILSADPCFGACDIQTPSEVDLTIHFGHNKFMENEKVIYIETHSDLKIKPIVEKAIPLLGNTIGLVTTVQHIHKINEMREILEKNGKKVIIAQSSGRAVKGQVLGCDASSALNAESDCILFVGSGEFHPLNIAFTTKKKTIQANPYTQEVKEMSSEKWEKEKILRIEKARDSETFGIVYSEKPGQKNLALAEALKSISRNSYLIKLDFISPENLDYLPFDAFVITACPRIVLDDWKNYKKPILLPEEFKKLLA